MKSKQVLGLTLAIAMVATVFAPAVSAAGEGKGIDLNASIKEPKPEIAITVDVGSIDFGELLPGETSASGPVAVTNIGLRTVDVSLTVEDNGSEAIFVPGITVNGNAWGQYSTILLSDGSISFDVALHIPDTVTARGDISGSLTVWAEEKLNIYSTALENTNPGAPDAGIPGFVGPDGIGRSTANNYVNPVFATWASYVVDYTPTAQGINPMFSNPDKTLGPVTGDNFHIVSLGDLTAAMIAAGDSPGSLTLGFDAVIFDGPGPDFAAFENGFISGGGAGVAGQIFAELGYVEVSTDGVTFVRFPSVSITSGDVGGYGTVDPTSVYNLVGKHVNAYGDSWGTPFDLSDLVNEPEVLSGAVDLNNINFVRIVDIPGSGDFKDSLGNPIYDAWVTTGSGGVDFEALGVINASPRPFVKFSADIIGGVAPLTVQFTDRSTNSPTSWYWEFGDGETSTEQNPRHTYNVPGNYTVTLTASNGFGSGTVTKAAFITATAEAVIPTAAFSARVVGGIAPLTVQFTDLSLGQPLLWSWSFGDGSTSSEREPSHTYETPGVYTVTLSVTNPAGSDDEIKADMIAVIEPISEEVLLASTYLGGSGDETMNDAYDVVAVAGDGTIYVIGSTTSADLPATSGAYRTGYGGGTDVFIARYSSDMSALLALTYLGGSGSDRAASIAVSGDGSVYVIGTTNSDGLATTGAAQAVRGGGSDVFVAKLDAALSSLTAFTYLGGTSTDSGRSIALAEDGSVYVTATTASDGLSTEGANRTARGGGNDGLVARFDASLALLACTYFGGASTDQAYGVTVAGDGSVYVTGFAMSTGLATGGASQTKNGGSADAYIARFDASLSTLLACTYLGGGGLDRGVGVAVAGDGSVYLVGYSGSAGLSTEGAFDRTLETSMALSFDTIVARFDASLSTLLALTYLGGTYGETRCEIEVRGDRVLVAVETGSDDMPITLGAFSETYTAGTDAYIACFDPMLSTLLYGTYFGGAGDEDIGGLAITADGTVVLVGYTASADLPTMSAADDSHNGGDDLFLTIWDLA